MSKRNFKIIKNEYLSKTRNDERYVVVDSNTGKILDNAQGYGYKSYENAYRSYTYKTGSKYINIRNILIRNRRLRNG